MADTTTDNEEQLDEFGNPIPTQEEMEQEQAARDAERAKTAQTIALVGAMNQTVAPLASSLPTQSDPVAPPRGNSYMGPNIAAPDASPQQFFRDNSFLQGSHSFITPPAPSPEQQAAAQSRVAAATGGESDASALSRLQATDRPGTRTIGVQSEEPYSDASLANQQNMMRYNAMKAFEAGDRSPEVLAAAMGTRMVGPAIRPMTEYQRSMDSHRKFLEQQAANKVAPIPRNMVLEKAIADERAALYKARADLAKLPATSGTDPRVGNAMQHARKLKELNDQFLQMQAPTTATATPAAAAPVAPPTAQSKGTLTRAKAQEFLGQANGDKAKARQLARNAGYEL